MQRLVILYTCFIRMVEMAAVESAHDRPILQPVAAVVLVT
jgi:hypothetical protein